MAPIHFQLQKPDPLTSPSPFSGSSRSGSQTMMFGRVRPPSSSPDSLERGPSKISKNDHLSVYEATLMKLKRGSELDLSPQLDELDIDCGSSTSPLNSSEDTTVTIPEIMPKSCLLKCSLGVSQHNKEEMMIDTDCSSASILSGSSDSQSTSSPNEHERNVSVIYMFSKFKSSRRALSLCHEAMELETDDSSSASLCI